MVTWFDQCSGWVGGPLPIRTDSSFSPPKLRYSRIVLGSISLPAVTFRPFDPHLSFLISKVVIFPSALIEESSHVTNLHVNKSFTFGSVIHSMFQERQICSSNLLWLQLILKLGGREQGQSLALMTCHKQKTESSQQLDRCPV